MKDLSKINPQFILRIEVVRKKRHEYIEYVEEVKFLWITIKRGGFYGLNGYYTREQLLEFKNLVIDNNNIVYIKPHVIVYLVDKEEYYYYFKNDQEVYNFLNREEFKNCSIQIEE